MSDADGHRTLAGIGFGPIQACLFLHEARHGGKFGRLAVGLRRADLARGIRSAGNRVFVNTATYGGIESHEIAAVDARLLGDAADRECFVGDLVSAEEIAVAVSGVDQYATSGPESVHRLLATAIREKARGHGPPTLVYAAENHADAAGILERAVHAEVPEAERANCQNVVQFCNTVISKISMAIRNAEEISARGLRPAVDGIAHAFLAERRARILIDAVDPERTSGRHLSGLVEKEDLAPFDQAKLYGQNSIHTACGFFGLILGKQLMSEVSAMPAIRNLLLAMSRREFGSVLVSRYHGIDPLFTEDGIHAYTEELLERMSNPWIPDTCARTGRDPGRKLAWNDRIVGILRASLDSGLNPVGLGFATLAGLKVWSGSDKSLEPLVALWRSENVPASDIDRIVRFLDGVRPDFHAWMSKIRPAGPQGPAVAGRTVSQREFNR